MLKRFLFGIALISLMTSCVSSKIYEDLQSKYDLLKEENKSLLSQLNEGTNENSYSIKNLQNELEILKAEKSRLAMDLAASKSSYDRLKDSYDALDANSSSKLTENLALNRTLLRKLEEKEKQVLIMDKNQSCKTKETKEKYMIYYRVVEILSQIILF